MALTSDKQIRERLVSRGVSSLSDSELLSLIIKENSTAPDAAHSVAHELLHYFGGSLSELSNADMSKLRMVAGLGMRNAATIMAAGELGRRMAQSEAPSITAIRSNEDVCAIFQPLLGTLQHEEMWVLYLSSANTILDRVRISQGGVSGTVFDHKLIVKRAVELLAVGIILVHNHPSGSTEPSSDDLTNTQRVLMAASLFDITLLDHVIITKNDSCSMRQHGLLNEQ